MARGTLTESTAPDWFSQNAPTITASTNVVGPSTPENTTYHDPNGQVRTGTGQIITPPGITGGAKTGGNAQALIDQWRQSHPPTNADLPGLIALLKQNGINASQATHANGTLPSDERIIIDGQMYKLGHSLGGSDGFWFQGLTPESSGGDSSFGGLLDQAPGAFPTVPNYPEFQMPTGEDALKQDPGYLFRKSQGEQGLLQNRAARGTLNTGGTLKNLVDYNQNAASQEYGNVFDRALKTYQTNFGTQVGGSNYGNLYQQYLDQAAQLRGRQQDAFNNFDSLTRGTTPAA